jgi:hypothetical protein
MTENECSSSKEFTLPPIVHNNNSTNKHDKHQQQHQQNKNKKSNPNGNEQCKIDKLINTKQQR